MNSSNRSHNNDQYNDSMNHLDMDISKASYHGSSARKDCSDSTLMTTTMMDGPKKLAVLSVAKSLSTFDQEQHTSTSPTSTTSPVRSKRTKARRQSGQPTADINQDEFKRLGKSASGRPFLPRDDSLFLLKQNTTNAIPMIVPLVVSDDAASVAEKPLARIQEQRRNSHCHNHRSKPRRMSGDAVTVTRPSLVEREDSVMLAKRKLMASYGAFDMDASTQSQESHVSTTETVDEDANEQELEEEEPKQEGKKLETEEEDKKPAATTTGKSAVPSLNRKQKIRGVVRQKSFGPPCA